jgi:hypothetical protein
MAAVTAAGGALEEVAVEELPGTKAPSTGRETWRKIDAMLPAEREKLDAEVWEGTLRTSSR